MKNQKNFKKLMESILIDFIICGIMSTVLSAVSALIKNYYMPIAVNSNYMEDIASGGTGIATVSVGNTLADIIDYIDIITVILIFGVFITKWQEKCHIFSVANGLPFKKLCTDGRSGTHACGEFKGCKHSNACFASN